MFAEAMSGNPDKLLTLTVRPRKGETVDERAQNLVKAFVQLLRAAEARFKRGKNEYYAVFEKTKRGQPHLHILLRGPYIPHRWISAFMFRKIRAPIIDIRQIDCIGKASAYVSKYMTKDPTRFLGCKRYWSSRGYKIGWNEDADTDDYVPPRRHIEATAWPDFLTKIENLGYAYREVEGGVMMYIGIWFYGRGDYG